MKGKRGRGTIQILPSGSRRVRVYVGVDPISKRRLYATEVVPITTTAKAADAEAEKVRIRLVNEVNERRTPKTRATVNQLIERYLKILRVDPSTRKTYVGYIRNHIKPRMGEVQVARVNVELLESFYAELRTCRLHCGGRPLIKHRTTRKHICDEHAGPICKPADPDCRACRRACKRHRCNGLSDSTVRQIHWIVSGMLALAVRWSWITSNPAEHAEPGPVPMANPRPPSAADAARLIEAAWEDDPDWGSFLWTKMTMGSRRAEMCALRENDLEPAKVVSIHKAIYKDDEGQLREKGTKTHQQRRVVIDDNTYGVVRAQIQRQHSRAAALGLQMVKNPYIWSPSPDGSTPPSPDAVSSRFTRLATRLGIDTCLKNLRHYSATELIAGGVDLRTVAGRLGHGGGGATTLRVYAAWTSEADQRAAATLSGRMPALPEGAILTLGTAANTAHPPTPAKKVTVGPYHQIADDLRGAIAAGILRPGDPIPPMKALAERYGVAPSTIHRAITILKEGGYVDGSRGRRIVVTSR